MSDRKRSSDEGTYNSNDGDGSQTPPLHKGFWTEEEEKYANALMNEFRAGRLPLVAEGTTLRAFLAKMLNCHPKRVSKHFRGKDYSGKQAYIRRPNKLSAEEAQARRDELQELERKFNRVSTAPRVTVAPSSTSPPSINTMVASLPHPQTLPSAEAGMASVGSGLAPTNQLSSADMSRFAALDAQNHQRQLELLRELSSQGSAATHSDDVSQLQRYPELLQRNRNLASGSQGWPQSLLLGELIRYRNASQQSANPVSSTSSNPTVSDLLSSLQRERELNLFNTGGGGDAVRQAASLSRLLGTSGDAVAGRTATTLSSLSGPSLSVNLLQRSSSLSGISGNVGNLGSNQTTRPSSTISGQLNSEAFAMRLNSTTAGAGASANPLSNLSLTSSSDIYSNLGSLLGSSQGSSLEERLNEQLLRSSIEQRLSDQLLQRWAMPPPDDGSARVAAGIRNEVQQQLNAQSLTNISQSNAQLIRNALQQQRDLAGNPPDQRQRESSEEKTIAASLKRDKSSSGDSDSVSDDDDRKPKSKMPRSK